MRTLLDATEAGDERAALAVDIFCYRLAKSLAGLAVALPQIDAIVFTGGIGEHAAVVREKTVAQLAILGVALDAERNRQHGRASHGFISKAEGSVPVLVIATSEETMIARYAYELLKREENIT